MKKIAKWLAEHAVVLGGGGKESVVHLWCIVVSFVLTLCFALCGWTGKAMEWLLMVLLLGGTVLPPIIEAVRALVTHDKWTPWYWFPIVIGNALGVGLTMLVCWIFGIV